MSDETLEPATESYRPALDKTVFTVSLALVLLFAAFLIADPENAAASTRALRDFLTSKVGWFYLITGIMPVAFCAWLAFGRYGDVKLGAPDEPPEYSTFSWAAMMFTASMGASLIAWGFAEPVFYLQTPPFAIEPHSNEAFEWAHMYPLYHWSLIPWAMYCLPGLPIAYMLFVRDKQVMRISASCDAFIPEENKKTRTALDIFVLLSVVSGVATSLGFGVPLVSSLLVELTDVPDTLGTKIFVIVLWTAIFGTSAYLGLKKGIRVLSDINLVLMIFVMGFVLLLGPTVFILSITTNSIGLLLDNVLRMSFWTDPIAKSGFPESWTIFYWAWWLAYVPMMGLFFGRISRGRTIKQYICGVIGIGSFGAISFLSIAGAYVLHLELNGILDTTAVLNERGMGGLVAVVISHLPARDFILTVVTLLSIIFYATTFDSAAFVLASICTKNLPSHEEPGRKNRLLWACVLGVVAIGLMVAGTRSNAIEETVKSITVISSIPLIPVFFMMSYTFYKWLKKDIDGVED